jgi:hypothetical protein
MGYLNDIYQKRIGIYKDQESFSEKVIKSRLKFLYNSTRHYKSLYDCQKKYIKAVSLNNYVLVKKTRQIGASILAASIMLKKLMFQNNQTMMFLTGNQSTSNNAKSFFEDGFHEISKHIKSPHNSINSITTDSICFGSNVVYFKRTHPLSVHGMSLNFVVFDEFDFINERDVRETLLRTLPSIQVMNGKIIMQSSIGNSYLTEKWNESPSDWHKLAMEI